MAMSNAKFLKNMLEINEADKKEYPRRKPLLTKAVEDGIKSVLDEAKKYDNDEEFINVLFNRALIANPPIAENK